jgi:hypothetical protein
MQVATHATLRISGDDLNPDAVAKDMGVMADEAHRKGDITGTRTRVVKKTGYWAVTSSEHMDEFVDVNVHLQWIVDLVSPRKNVIAAYRSRGWEVDLWLGIHTSAGHGGPTVRAEVIRALGGLELDLNLDLYPDDLTPNAGPSILPS